MSASAPSGPRTVSLADEDGVKQVLVGTLLQVRHLHDTPLILVGKMWGELLQRARTYMLDPRLHLVDAEDLSIPRCVTTADEAIALSRDHHGRWLQAQPGPAPAGGR